MRSLFQNNAGARLTPVKGFCIALAMVLPLFVLTMFGQRAFGVLIMMGALLTSFGDVGLVPHTQARLLGMIAVSGALMTALGRIVGGPWWCEILAVFLAVLLGGLFSVFGQFASVIGLLVTIAFVSSLAKRSGPATALPAAGGFLLGGVIVMLLACVCAWLSSSRNAPRNEAQATQLQTGRTTFTEWFTLSSPLLRLNVLRAVGAAVAAGSGWIWAASPFYWAVLPVIICTRQDQRASLKLALQNVIATFLGAFLAAAILASVQNTFVVGLIVVVITFLAFTVKELNYLVYLFFFTIVILLLISIAKAGQSFAVWRMITVLFGAGIVLVITFLPRIPFGKRKGLSP